LSSFVSKTVSSRVSTGGTQTQNGSSIGYL
jgi:hypothetical protein